MIESIREIAAYAFLGKPLVFDTGILTLLSFMFTAFISVSNLKGYHIIPFKWHPRMAAISFVFALIHAALALSIYL